jgi:hypothetical protein
MDKEGRRKRVPARRAAVMAAKENLILNECDIIILL